MTALNAQPAAGYSSFQIQIDCSENAQQQIGTSELQVCMPNMLLYCTLILLLQVEAAGGLARSAADLKAALQHVLRSSEAACTSIFQVGPTSVACAVAFIAILMLALGLSPVCVLQRKSDMHTATNIIQ